MNHKNTILTISLFILLSISLAACATSADAPAQTIERYHQALVDKNEEQMVNLSCADWEFMAMLELDSFVSVETTLVDAACQTVSQEGDRAYVTCEGAISASYDGEAREFPLSGQTYLVVQEAGEWRMCGYE